jgi:Ca2+-binding RTX toxin-like protein
VTLYNTNGPWDGVAGSNGVVELNGATATINGNSDTLYFNGGQNVASVTGSQNAFVFQAAIGQNTVTGFVATDTMQFSKSDFANWSALLSHTAQSGANAVITLDANDTVNLTEVTAAYLTSSQFRFV